MALSRSSLLACAMSFFSRASSEAESVTPARESLNAVIESRWAGEWAASGREDRAMTAQAIKPWIRAEAGGDIDPSTPEAA